jgi:hypothetical protein
MSLKHEHENIEISAGILNLVHNTKVVVPFAVMAWDGDDTEWYPVFVCISLEIALETVKKILRENPNEPWDIQQNVEIKVSEFLK